MTKQVRVEIPEGLEHLNLPKLYESATNRHGDEVYVGQHLTATLFSDRTPFTIVGVSKSGAKIVIQRDDADFENFNPFDGYAPAKRDTEGEYQVLNLKRKYNRYGGESSGSYTLDAWSYYRDPHF